MYPFISYCPFCEYNEIEFVDIDDFGWDIGWDDVDGESDEEEDEIMYCPNCEAIFRASEALYEESEEDE